MIPSLRVLDGKPLETDENSSRKNRRKNQKKIQKSLEKLNEDDKRHIDLQQALKSQTKEKEQSNSSVIEAQNRSNPDKISHSKRPKLQKLEQDQIYVRLNNNNKSLSSEEHPVSEQTKSELQCQYHEQASSTPTSTSSDNNQSTAEMKR